MRDFLPPAAARRRELAEELVGEFERWGYERIITPAFEYLDVLARGLGDGARAAAIRFVEPATGEVVALRPDITPQVARIAATRLGETRGPIRLAYEGSVMRLVAGGRGQRELIQAGVELIDAPAPAGDAEVIALAGAALRAAGVGGVTIDVGHVALVRVALEGIDEPARRAELEDLIARGDSDGVRRAARGRKLLAELPELHGPPGDVLKRARALPIGAAGRRAIDELEETLLLVAAQGGGERLTVDLGDVRGFTYYTGVRFAGYVDGVGDAVLRGGRYDDLIGRFGRSARATGFAVDVEAIAQAEHARGAHAPAAARGVVFYCTGGAACRARAFRAATRLRGMGHRAAVNLGAVEDGVGWQVRVSCDGKRTRVVGGGVVPNELLTSGRAESLARALGLVRQQG